MTSLPPIETIDESQIGHILRTLLESNIPFDPLLPAGNPGFVSYTELLDAALAQVATWSVSTRAKFIAGHPRIGETKNLSVLSAKEQGATPTVAPTPPEVLARLAHLNACYERRYSGLRYITFVNGRSRAEIAREMEDVLGLPHSLSPDQPPVEEITVIKPETDAWTSELDRAVVDVGRIAHSRLGAMKIQESQSSALN
ncbi:putative allantoinase 1 [Mycena sanguinolenta]|uniref:Putative allantoinase 1 n=1 Tax=Mycena sanguinolenta TaxID=230812 RepID=A0A8H6Z1G7_9AGAR|nr:putative allantoinase 1 [Mycena sanguinolenta]